MFANRKESYYAAHFDGLADELRGGSLRAIPQIFCILALDAPPCKLKAARALSDVLQGLSFDEICAVDRQMRDTTSMEWSIDWRKLKIGSLLTWRMDAGERRAVTVFASFNPNGYMRQEAVERLSAYPDALPFIILRLNDWVPNVGQAAIDALRIRLKTADADELVAALPYAEAIKNKNRLKGKEALDIIAARLLGDENLKRMALQSGNLKTRRFCLLALSRSKAGGDRQLFLEHAKRERDPFLRRLIFDKLLSADTDKTEVCLMFIGDKAPATRAKALQRLYDHNSALAVQHADMLMFDRNPFVRETARDILSQSGTALNFRELYIANLNSRTVSGISGLGEVGAKEDCKIIEPYMRSDNDKIVSAAMTALMRLDADRYTPVITEALASPRAGVVKTAALLLRRGGMYDHVRVFEIAQSTEYENSRVKCAALLFEAPKWESLTYVLSLTGSGHTKLETLCQAQLRRWLIKSNRSYQALTEEKAKVLSALIDEKADCLDGKLRAQLRFALS